MARPRKDGADPRAINRRVLTELLVRKVRPEPSAFNIWDLNARGLVLRVQPSGHRAFKFVYSYRGRPRWYHLGPIGLADARKLAAEIRLDVVRGRDPAQERKAQRSAGTFADLAASYVELHARKRNKSWQRADALVRRFLLPRWGKLQASSISRSDLGHVPTFHNARSANRVLSLPALGYRKGEDRRARPGGLAELRCPPHPSWAGVGRARGGGYLARRPPP